MKFLSKSARLLALLIILSGEMFLTSCSTLSLTYQYADWLLQWKIEHYIDVTTEQSRYLNNQLGLFKKWHKSNELPRYILFLKDVKTQWHDGLTQQDLEAMTQEYRSLWKSLIDRLSIESAPFLITLNPDQIQGLQETIQQDNRQLLDEGGTNQQDRLDKKVKKVIDRIEYWLGPLSSDQNDRISLLIRRLPDTFHVWFTNRVRRQDSFIALLRQDTKEIDIQQRIRDLLITPEKGATHEYVSTMKRFEDSLFPITLKIDQIINAQQRKHAEGQMELFIKDLQHILYD